MNSDDLEKARGLFWLSIALFIVSLTRPAYEDMRGWQVFLLVFWMLPQALLEPASSLLVLSGAAANVLLFFSWVAIPVSRVRKFGFRTASGAVVLACLNWVRMPLNELQIGYWLWLGSCVVVWCAALDLRAHRGG
jgi:hypothetical protein